VNYIGTKAIYAPGKRCPEDNVYDQDEACASVGKYLRLSKQSPSDDNVNQADDC